MLFCLSQYSDSEYRFFYFLLYSAIHYEAAHSYNATVPLDERHVNQFIYQTKRDGIKCRKRRQGFAGRGGGREG
jgi:hypothetical protein